MQGFRKIEKMKPSKKQINPTDNINQVKEKNVQGIQTFFKTTPKTFVVDKNVVAAKPDDGPKKFYVDILKDKLRRKIFLSLNFVYDVIRVSNS